MNRYLSTCMMLVCGCLQFAGTRAAEIDFEADIYPILEDNCLFCHGEDEQESGLRLDRRPFLLRGGDSGLPAVVPGKPSKSYLVEVINHIDPDMAMPPDEDKLADDDLALIERWIQQGAVWPGQMDEVIDNEVDHWAFLPRQTQFRHHSIDAFLRAKLQDVGLDFSVPADPQSLVRRASIVLTGLAPTPERVKTFVRDFDRDSESAYADLVDELMASPQFGERWAQHWLDVIRWAETNGSESNLYRKNAWMYRDYVVRAFNDDKPYDQFIREQLAGDILGHGDATGFLVAGPHVPAATVGQEPSAIRQARADRMDEIMQTVGASVMGVTIGCARCHNHKFDPISIQDYYSLTAVFQDVEFGSRYPELSDDHPRIKRERELREQLTSLRQQMRSKGWAWVEDWQGYEEIHFPPIEVDQLRVTFDKRWVQIDELEIYETSDGASNLLVPASTVSITDNPATTTKPLPPSKLNDGVFGTKGWRGVSPKGNPEQPWLEFVWSGRRPAAMIRLSTNREDFLQTDYLEGMNKRNYGDFRIQIRDDNGQWKAIASTATMRQRTVEIKERQLLQTQIQSLIGELLVEGPQPAFLAQFVSPVDTFVLARGSPESPRDQVFADAPRMLGGELDVSPDSPGPMRRRALADWLVTPENPLAARVMTNRLWHHVFGSGIVPTTSDFGRAGAAPTHPELLDWLAGQFIDSNWSMKEVIHTMVMSQAFRQSSQPDPKGLEVDASAQLLWRFPPRRVEAEVIRDSVLLASGCLDKTVGGPSYRIHNVKKRYSQWEVVDNSSQQTWRRMLYQERMRRVDDRIFTAFDFPDCGQIRAKRPVSTTPLQALNLMNSEFVVEQSELLAKRAIDEAGTEISAQVNRLFELLLGRSPSADERAAAVEFTKSESLPLLARTLINTNEFAFLP